MTAQLQRICRQLPYKAPHKQVKDEKKSPIFGPISDLEDMGVDQEVDVGRGHHRGRNLGYIYRPRESHLSPAGKCQQHDHTQRTGSVGGRRDFPSKSRRDGHQNRLDSTRGKQPYPTTRTKGAAELAQNQPAGDKKPQAHGNLLQIDNVATYAQRANGQQGGVTRLIRSEDVVVWEGGGVDYARCEREAHQLGFKDETISDIGRQDTLRFII